MDRRRVRGSSSVITISSQAALGYSSGDAIAEVERIAQRLPAGICHEWSGQSLKELQSGWQVPMLLGLPCLLIFLRMAVLHESPAVLFSVMVVISLRIMGGT